MIWALLACTATPVDSGEPVACPSYSGLEAVGRVVSWQVHEAPSSDEVVGGAWTSTARADGDRRVVVVDGAFERSDGVTVGFVGADTFRCDADGAWLERSERTLSTPDGDVRTSYTYDPGPLYFPADLGPQSDWSQTVRVVVGVGDKDDEPQTSEWHGQVLGAYVLTTPAGTFEGLDARLDDRALFLDAELGPVRDPDAFVVGWTDPG